jgi:hypothetical protein
MPCDTIRKTTVLVTGMHKQILVDGLLAAGFDARLTESGQVVFCKRGSYLYHTYADGKLEINGVGSAVIGQVEDFVSEVKRAYSAQVVRATAAKFGWTLKETKTAKGVQFEALRRR